MTPDIGGVSWFGDSNRAAALRRARLHYHCSSLAEPCVADEPLVHLIDIGDAEVKRAAAWIAARCEAGDGVLVALRDAGLARALSSSMVVLRAGRIAHHAPSRARVAERGFVDRPLRHA